MLFPLLSSLLHHLPGSALHLLFLPSQENHYGGPTERVNPLAISTSIDPLLLLLGFLYNFNLIVFFYLVSVFPARMELHEGRGCICFAHLVIPARCLAHHRHSKYHILIICVFLYWIFSSLSVLAFLLPYVFNSRELIFHNLTSLTSGIIL